MHFEYNYSILSISIVHFSHKIHILLVMCLFFTSFVKNKNYHHFER